MFPHDYFACDYFGGDYWPPGCEVERRKGGRKRSWADERELANARAAMRRAVLDGRWPADLEEEEYLALWMLMH